MATQYETWLKTLGTVRADMPVTVRGQAMSHEVRYFGDVTDAVLAGTVKASPDSTTELAVFTVSAPTYDAENDQTSWTIGLTSGQTAFPSVPDSDGDGETVLIYDFLITPFGESERRLFGGLFPISGFVTEPGTAPIPPSGTGTVLVDINNLSDVANVATARTNLDVYSTSEVDAAIAAVPAYTDEQARDAIGAALVAGANVTITPNEGADTITIAASTDAEVVRDTIGTALVAGTGITITPNDGADTITIAASGGGGTAADLEYFGDGSDGDVTISSGTTVLTRNMYYNNLTISGTGKLETRGFIPYIKGTLDISAAPVDAITTGNASGSFNGATGGTVTGGTGAAVTLNSGAPIAASSPQATQGGSGTTGAGAQGVAPTNPQYSLNYPAGAGGKGGNVGATNGGASRAAAVASIPSDLRRLNADMLSWLGGGLRFILAGMGAPGGSSGAGDGVGQGGGGGGGGGGGCGLIICAATINRSGSTAAGAISSRGGNGGNGQVGSGGTNRGGGGGGGGGSGGWIILIYKTLTGSTATGCIDVTGGNGGNGGTGTGTGIGGDGGSAGSSGRADIYNVGAGTLSISTVASVVAGTAGSGVTAGTGGVATVTRVSL